MNVLKNFVLKHGATLSAFAIFVTTMNVNRTCYSILHQPEVPKNAKKLRKF